MRSDSRPGICCWLLPPLHCPTGLNEAYDIGDVLIADEPVIGRHGEGGRRSLCCRQRTPGQDDVDGGCRICRLQQGIAGERREHPPIAPAVAATERLLLHGKTARRVAGDGKAYLSGGCEQGNVSP